MSKRVLVTGGAGFVGHHLIQHIFINTDWDVVCLDRLDTSGNLNRLSEILEATPRYKPRFEFVFHDLRAEINSNVARRLNKPHVIFHLAASSHVDRSIQDPLSFVYDNVVGTCNILNYARQVDNIEYIQSFGTDEVFGDAAKGQSYKEGDRHNPKNPYSSSKSGQETLGIAFRNTYKLPIVSTNTVNILGERQHREKYLPLVINKILAGEELQVHCHPGCLEAGTRQYVHARNVAAACLFLRENANIGESYNIPGQVELSNLEIAEYIAKVIGKPLIYKMVDFHSDRPGHDLRYSLDGTKLMSMGFSYPVEFYSSLEKTIKWYLNHPEWLR